MPFQLQGFNPSQVAPATILPPVEAGWYKCAIVSSEMKPTAAGTGAYAEFVEQVLEGEHAGRKFYERLNLSNPNPQAVEIAYGTLSAICRACGIVRDPGNSQALHGIPHMVRVSVRPAGVGRDGRSFNATNEIEEYGNLSGVPLSQIQEGAPAGSVPSWAGQQTSPGPVNGASGPAFPGPAAPAPAAPAPLSAVHAMTAAAQFTYEQYAQAGWTDEQLIAKGYMQPPTPPAPAIPAPPGPVPSPVRSPTAANIAAPPPLRGIPGPAMPPAASPQSTGGARPPWLPQQ